MFFGCMLLELSTFPISYLLFPIFFFSSFLSVWRDSERLLKCGVRVRGRGKKQAKDRKSKKKNSPNFAVVYCVRFCFWCVSVNFKYLLRSFIRG